MKPFKSNSLVFTVAGALALSSISIPAAEHTVKSGPFEQTIQLQATGMPIVELGENAIHPISIKPEVWSVVKIEKFLPHGSSVKKGEKLFWIDTEALDKKIEAFTKERVKQRLVLNKAEIDLASKKAATAESLAKAKLDYERFQENYDYYKKVTKPQQAIDTEYKVKRAKDYLSYTQEELDQLLKMYDEDGLTEETEEIIITRSKHSLADSQRNVEKEERVAHYKKSIATPRNDADWSISAVTKKRVYELTQKKLPIDLKLKELDLAKLKSDDEKAEKQLNDLKADRALMEFKAPADGVLYLGEFQGGKWLTEEANKIVRKGGVIPASMTLMTIVPVDAKLKFNAFLSEKQKRIFNVDQTGSLRLNSNRWVSISVEAELVNEHPNFSHQWLVSFTAKDDVGAAALAGAMIGSKAEVSIVTASEDNVLSVPTNAVKSNPDGTYSVKVMMAEGDPKVTNVELGRQAGDKLEVLSGLENGQVILTP